MCHEPWFFVWEKPHSCFCSVFDASCTRVQYQHDFFFETKYNRVRHFAICIFFLEFVDVILQMSLFFSKFDVISRTSFVSLCLTWWWMPARFSRRYPSVLQSSWFIWPPSPSLAQASIRLAVSELKWFTTTTGTSMSVPKLS